MNRNSRKGRRGGAWILGLIIPTVIVLSSPGVASATACQTGGSNWYGRAIAPVGAGTAEGSAMLESMPATYYAGVNATSDEATWMINSTWAYQNEIGNYTSNGAWELGWFQGIWPYSPSHPFYYAPHAYATTFNGYSGAILNASDLPMNGDYVQYLVSYVGSSCPGNSVWDENTSTYYYQSNSCSGSSIIIPTPRFAQSQGEVADGTGNPQGTDMGGNGGNGLQSSASYQALSNNGWYNWGSFSTCNNSPYWITSNSSNSWTNGGS